MREVRASSPDCHSSNMSDDPSKYEPKVGKSVVQVLFVRVDIGVVIYEEITPSVSGQWFRSCSEFKYE